MEDGWTLVGKKGNNKNDNLQASQPLQSAKLEDIMLIKGRISEEDAALLLDRSEQLNINPAPHPRQHAWSNGKYATDIKDKYLKRPKHSVYKTYGDQNKATQAILNSDVGIFALETLKSKGLNTRVVIFFPVPVGLNFKMMELNFGQPGEDYKPTNITLVIDYLTYNTQNIISLQTDYPTEELPPIVKNQILPGTPLFTMNLGGVKTLYYINDRRRFELSYDSKVILQKIERTKSLSDNLGLSRSVLFPHLDPALAMSLADQPILLNGMKVVFDQATPVYPVSLEDAAREAGDGA